MSKSTDRKAPWYTEKLGADVHEQVYQAAVHLAKRDGRREFLRTLRKVFADEPVDAKVQWYERDRMARWNVICSGVETMAARLAKTRPRPMFMTYGGDRRLQDRAEAATDWTDGEFERLRSYDLMDEATLDSLIYGHGVLHVCIEADRPSLEVDWVGDHHVDPREERHRCVRTRYRTKRVDRHVLASVPAYKKFKAQIMDAEDGLHDEEGSDEDYDGQADLILVVESWRLDPFGNGRHTIVTNNATLVHREWKRPRFPFIDLAWTKDPASYWGVGEVRRMLGMQAELTELSTTINKAYRHIVGRWVLDTSSGMTKEQIGNDPGEIAEHEGGPPPLSYIAPSPVSPDMLQREQVLQQAILHMRGISHDSATSSAPAYEESGRAKEVRQDIESSRHFPVEKRRETGFVELAQQLYWRAEELVTDEKRSEKVKLTAMGGKRTLRMIDFSDARLDAQEYTIRCTPVANLSRTASAKLAELKELVALGEIQPGSGEIREHMELPDTGRSADISLAKRRLAEFLVGKAAKGERVAAEPFMDLDHAIQTASAELCMAIHEGGREDAIDALADLVGSIETEIAKRNAALAPTPVDPAMAANGPVPAGAPAPGMM